MPYWTTKPSKMNKGIYYADIFEIHIYSMDEAIRCVEPFDILRIFDVITYRDDPFGSFRLILNL